MENRENDILILIKSNKSNLIFESPTLITK